MTAARKGDPRRLLTLGEVANLLVDALERAEVEAKPEPKKRRKR